MTAQRLIFLRHGQTDYNRDGRIQGQVDIPLNGEGLRQARAAASGLSTYLRGASVTRLIASPLARARVTADIVGEVLGVDVVEDGRLQERAYGKFEGLNRSELEEFWSTEYALWKAGENPEGLGVETKTSVAERAVAAVTDAMGEMADGGTLLVVAHGALLTQATLTLIDDDPERGSPLRGLDNCHWSELGRQERRGPDWQLRVHNMSAEFFS